MSDEIRALSPASAHIRAAAWLALREWRHLRHLSDPDYAAEYREHLLYLFKQYRNLVLIGVGADKRRAIAAARRRGIELPTGNSLNVVLWDLGKNNQTSWVETPYGFALIGEEHEQPA